MTSRTAAAAAGAADRLAAATDVPWMTVESHPVPTAANPLGATGPDEAGTVGALAAVTSAVGDALARVGMSQLDMPATPDRVWRAIRDARALASAGPRGQLAQHAEPSPDRPTTTAARA